jgi:hypothetical protein
MEASPSKLQTLGCSWDWRIPVWKEENLVGGETLIKVQMQIEVLAYSKVVNKKRTMVVR